MGCFSIHKGRDRAEEPKALTSSSFRNARSFHRQAERRRGSSRATSHSAPLASGGYDGTPLHLFPLPLPASDLCASSTSEDSSLQSMSSSSSASSSSSCSSAPFSACSVSRHKSHAYVANHVVVNTVTSFARPLPVPPVSSTGISPREYSYEELAGACLNFSQECFIRDGGAGPVFKALVRRNTDQESCAEIAVTRLIRGRLHSPKKWKAEIGRLARLSHPNICKVVGFSREDSFVSVDKPVYMQRERLLVYEHASNGSLESLLYGRKGRAPPLDWDTRVKIAVEAAQGLAFLHERMPRQITYKTFKTLNIQVDRGFITKLSDYGFARTPKELPFGTPARLLPQECAYAAPETRSYNEVTPKSNVWGFGIVLLELLTGRQHMDEFFAAEERNLLQWCRPHLVDTKRLYLMMDPELKGRYSTRKAKIVADLALRCLIHDPAARPSMVDVVAFLSPIAGGCYSPVIKPKQTSLSFNLHIDNNPHVGSGSFLSSGTKPNYSKSYSLASILASPARSFAANLHSNELHCSPAHDSSIRSRGFLSGVVIKNSCQVLTGWRGEHPFVSESSYASGEDMVHADDPCLN